MSPLTSAKTRRVMVSLAVATSALLAACAGTPIGPYEQADRRDEQEQEIHLRFRAIDTLAVYGGSSD